MSVEMCKPLLRHPHTPIFWLQMSSGLSCNSASFQMAKAPKRGTLLRPCKRTIIRKIRAPIKIKSALPPPKPKIPPPKTRGILRTWFFLQKERIFPRVHKIGAPISGPRIADTNFTDTRIFLILGHWTLLRTAGFVNGLSRSRGVPSKLA